MEQQVKIFGAGLAGLLAGNMLRRHSPIIQEIQPALPNNHSALLRFRTDLVSKETSIPFKKVKVLKAIKYRAELTTSPDLKLANMYAVKCTGKALSRSIMNLEPSERYIAPENFISQSSRNLNIEYGKGMEGIENGISTMPMNILMDIVGWTEKPEFNFSPIWSVNWKISDLPIDVYQTIYYPEQKYPFYRVSITGDLLIIEMNVNKKITAQEFVDVIADFGLCTGKLGTMYEDFEANAEYKFQKYGKLLPIDDRIRKEFILAMTDKYQIYSLGRFATWRQILMDDCVQDIKMIEDWMINRDSYKRSIQTK